MDKNSFVMYTTYAEHINLLTMEQRGLLLTAIMNYASGEPLPDMDGMTRMAFSFIKVQMDRDSEKYQATVEKRRESGKLGGRPSTKANGLSEKAKKANGFSEKQTKAKKPDNDNEYDNDNVNELKESIEKRHFVPPTTQNVADYCKEKGITTVDAERFVDFYSSKGWMVGKNRMKDWKAAVRNWGRKDAAAEPNNTKGNKFTNFEQRSYDCRELEGKLLAAGKE